MWPAMRLRTSPSRCHVPFTAMSRARSKGPRSRALTFGQTMTWTLPVSSSRARRQKRLPDRCAAHGNWARAPISRAKSWLSIGFCRNPSKGQTWPVARFSAALMRISIDAALRPPFLRISVANARPSVSGISRSIRTASKYALARRGRASVADAAALQRCPSRCVTSRSDSRTSARSSTTRTLSET